MQSLLVDPVGLGIGASYKRMAHHVPQGEWVWILDDDDVCVWRTLVADIRRIVCDTPAVQLIMVRMDHGPELGVLPDNGVWGKAPVHGRIGCSAFIVRRDLWERHKVAFSSGHYASDYDFICSVWAEHPVTVWHDVVASACPDGRSMGKVGE